MLYCNLTAASLLAPPDVITSAGHQLAAVLFYLGYIGVETDEPSAGEQLLEEALRAAPALGPCTVLSTLNALNQLGLVWSRRGEHNRSQHYLETAETVYRQYKEQITLKVGRTTCVGLGVESGWGSGRASEQTAKFAYSGLTLTLVACRGVERTPMVFRE